ncbi:unnamed protein product [Mycena citricolor]|uniref:Hyaluronan/mRNA-binding protein domain-containing protein n=1 Tax=Mycena citricolor TaxID=2018698 RepID=A0AAD2H0P2_9AGAR|nr:unnamed protein product [Mycena citricolor]CAK5281093.1 unnamed protein product [Mycena citricolor]
MTRTARSLSLRSVLKDRSESKNGMGNTMRKNGGGAHNWGSLENERDLEYAGMDDGHAELEGVQVEDDSDSLSTGSSSDDLVSSKKAPGSPVLERSDAEVAMARKFRMNALKGENVDLAAIARTSAAIPKTTNVSDIGSSSAVPV